jgi:hypothetical protein
MARVRELLSTVVRYGWAFPNTLLGLMFAPIAWLSGGEVKVVDGVLEVHSPLIAAILRHCIPLPGGAVAITCGHVVIGRDRGWLADSQQHERVHVRQYELWGPLFIPAYVIAGLWAIVNGQPAYAENYFEREARRAEPAGYVGFERWR